MHCFDYFLLSIHSPALQSLISYLAIFQQERDSQTDYPSAESEGYFLISLIFDFQMIKEHATILVINNVINVMYLSMSHKSSFTTLPL